MTNPTKPNDDRSDVKNPNNPAYEEDHANRRKLGHPNAPPPATPPPKTGAPTK